MSEKGDTSDALAYPQKPKNTENGNTGKTANYKIKGEVITT